MDYVSKELGNCVLCLFFISSFDLFVFFYARVNEVPNMHEVNIKVGIYF